MSKVQSNEVPDNPPDLKIEKIDHTINGSVLGTFIQQRYNENRDAKIIITSKGSTTGLGKSTLAIVLCYYADAYGWSAEEKGFVDVRDYVQKYKEVNEYSALLLDEIEKGADARRAMAQDNVDLSHAWATLRYRNVVSVATLPSVSMLDNRLMELGDIWINVVDKGKAIPHYLTINDYSGKLEKYPLRHPGTGNKEIITWPKLNNSDYREMQRLKDINVRTGEEHERYDKDDIEDAKEDAAREMRNELITAFYQSEDTNMSQKDIADVIGISQSMVAHILNEDD